MFRVFSGTVRPDSTVHNTTQGTDERIGQLFTQRGKEHESVSEVAAGDIGAVAKLQHAHTGRHARDEGRTRARCNRWTSRSHCSPTPSRPKTKGEEDKLATGLSRLREEDPTLRVTRNEETHETVMHGMGEAHLEVMIERLKRKFGVEVAHAAPRRSPSGRRSRGKAKATGRHVKQSGGHGQYAVCMIEIEPLPHGEGFVYESKIFGGSRSPSSSSPRSRRAS